MTNLISQPITPEDQPPILLDVVSIANLGHSLDPLHQVLVWGELGAGRGWFRKFLNPQDVRHDHSNNEQGSTSR